MDFFVITQFILLPLKFIHDDYGCYLPCIV